MERVNGRLVDQRSLPDPILKEAIDVLDRQIVFYHLHQALLGLCWCELLQGGQGFHQPVVHPRKSQLREFTRSRGHALKGQQVQFRAG